MKSDWAVRLKWKLMVALAVFLAVVVAATSTAISMTLDRAIKADSSAMTTELGGVVQGCLKELMQSRSPEGMGRVVNALATEQGAIARSFILDRTGTIRFSTHGTDVGRVLDRRIEPSCVVCHQTANPPATKTHLIREGGDTFLRNVTVLDNETPCQTCHGADNRIVGKIIIDRPMASTSRLLAIVRSIVIGAGLFSLVALVASLPAVGRSINRYVREIVQQESEITVLYAMVEHLSRTIEPRALRAIMLQTVLTTFDADDVAIVLAGDETDRQCYRLQRGDRSEWRAPVDDDPDIRGAFDRWIANALPGVAPIGAAVALPVSHEGARLGLIVIRRHEALSAQTTRLLAALSRHAAVALQNARLYALAIMDELTKLYSSRHFRTTIEACMQRWAEHQEPFALIFVDLDNFKRVNDTHGHAVGDDVLRRTATAMAGAVRGTDMAFRYGGEEFTALLPGASLDLALETAERIRAAVEQLRAPSWPEGLRMTVSVGVAGCPRDATTARDLIVRADAALYEAKRTGKNRVVSPPGA
jgi:diguanylate cyclase (GGDEF)-like protein